MRPSTRPHSTRHGRDEHGVTTNDEAEAAEALVRARAEAQLLADMGARHMPALRRYRGAVLGSSISADCTATVDGFNTVVVCDD